MHQGYRSTELHQDRQEVHAMHQGERQAKESALWRSQQTHQEEQPQEAQSLPSQAQMCICQTGHC